MQQSAQCRRFQGSRFCSVCGKAIPLNEPFCTFCGSPAPESDPGSTAPSRNASYTIMPTQRVNVAAIIISAVLLLHAIIFAIWAVSELKSSELQYYTYQQAMCKANQNECRDLMNSSPSRYRQSYQEIINEYQRLIDDYEEKISDIVTTGVWLFVGSGVCLLASIIIIIVFRKKDVPDYIPSYTLNN